MRSFAGGLLEGRARRGCRLSLSRTSVWACQSTSQRSYLGRSDADCGSFPLLSSDEHYERLVQQKKARQAASEATKTPLDSAPNAPPSAFAFDSSLTSLGASPLPLSDEPANIPSQSSSKSLSSTEGLSSRTAHIHRSALPLPHVGEKKPIEPDWIALETPSVVAATTRERAPSVGSSGSSGKSSLGFSVVKGPGKQREKSTMDEEEEPKSDKGTKRKSKKGANERGSHVEVADPASVEEDSFEVGAGKGEQSRRKMRTHMGGLDDLADISTLQDVSPFLFQTIICAIPAMPTLPFFSQYIPPSFPSNLATSTPVPTKRRPPSILRPSALQAQTGPPPSLSPQPACARERSNQPGPTSASPSSNDHSTSSRTTRASPPPPPPAAKARPANLLSRSSLLGPTSSQLLGPASSLQTKASADESLPFSLGPSQVDSRIDDVRAFLRDEEGELGQWN